MKNHLSIVSATKIIILHRFYYFLNFYVYNRTLLNIKLYLCKLFLKSKFFSLNIRSSKNFFINWYCNKFPLISNSLLTGAFESTDFFLYLNYKCSCYCGSYFFFNNFIEIWFFCNVTIQNY